MSKYLQVMAKEIETFLISKDYKAVVRIDRSDTCLYTFIHVGNDLLEQKQFDLDLVDFDMEVWVGLVEHLNIAIGNKLYTAELLEIVLRYAKPSKRYRLKNKYTAPIPLSNVAVTAVLVSVSTYLFYTIAYKYIESIF